MAMEKWYQEEYTWTVEVIGYLRGNTPEGYCRNGEETVSYTHLDVYKRQGLPHQGGLPQVLPGGSVLGIAPVEIDGPADEQDDGCGDDIAFPEFHRYFLTFLH